MIIDNVRWILWSVLLSFRIFAQSRRGFLMVVSSCWPVIFGVVGVFWTIVLSDRSFCGSLVDFGRSLLLGYLDDWVLLDHGVVGGSVGRLEIDRRGCNVTKRSSATARRGRGYLK